jgi:hypothetical protein
LGRYECVAYIGKLQEICPEFLKHAPTGSVLAPFFSPSQNSDWPDFLQLSHTFISSQPLQQPPEPDLVKLKREAVCSSETSGYTSTTRHRNPKEDHHTCMQNIVIMKRISLKIFLS